MATVDPGIVEYYGSGGAHRCGYCGNNGNCSHGMWAHSLTVQDYQDLIDRGWRRSGKYCYKPTMNKTCCPHYTIKMEALNFKLNKSHKKILKQMNKYLIHGTIKGESVKGGETKPGVSGAVKAGETKPGVSGAVKGGETKPGVSGAVKAGETKPGASSQDSDDITDTTPSKTPKAPPRPGAGADPNKPLMRKAKDIRLERKKSRDLIKLQSMTEDEAKAAHQLAKGLDREASTLSSMSIASSKNEAKTLADYLSEPDKADKCAHKLEIRLVRSNPRSKEFEESFKESHQVYHKYQMGIHHDPPHKPSESQYTRFLCDSPLQGQYFPSFLLCPETYTWLPIAECTPKLDVNKYSRFAAEDVEDDGGKLDINTVLVLFCRQIMNYEIYKALNAKARDAKEVMEYAVFVGRKCAQRMLLFRKS